MNPSLLQWAPSATAQLWRYRVLALAVPVLALVAQGLAARGSELPWLLDLATHWVWPAAGLLCLTLFFGSAVARMLSLVGCAMCASLLLNVAAPDHREAPASAVTVKLLNANVLATSTSSAAFLALLQKASPDIVAVQEVSPHWAQVLSAQTDYPYRRVLAQSDSFGIALLSRYPLEFEAPAIGGGGGTPSITATVSVPGARPLRVTVVHPIPPVSGNAHAARNRQLERVGAAVAGHLEPAVMVGDMNATPFSSPVQRLKQTGLVFATGWSPTWPSLPGFPGLITLDHVVVNAQVLSTRAEVGPHIGSDHRPVLAWLALPAVD